MSTCWEVGRLRAIFQKEVLTRATFHWKIAGGVAATPNIVQSCSEGPGANFIAHTVNSCCQVVGTVGTSDNGDLSGGTGYGHGLHQCLSHPKKSLY
jgi:hypothetical protein